MQKASEAKKKAKRIALMGLPGSRKTSLILYLTSLLPEGKTAFIADLDNNFRTAYEPLIAKTKLGAEPYFSSYEDKQTAEARKAVFPALKHNLAKAAKMDDVQLIAIDSQTRLTDIIIAKIKGDENRNSMRIQDWGTFAELLHDLFYEIMAARKTIVWVFHQKAVNRTEKDAEGNEVQVFKNYAPAVPGQSADTITSLFTDAWYSDIEAKKYKAKWWLHVTKQHDNPYIKNSFGLSESIELPLDSFNIAEKLKQKGICL